MKQRSTKNTFGENYMKFKIGIYPFYDIAGNEIIGYYSTDGTDKDMHKTFYPFARRLN